MSLKEYQLYFDEIINSSKNESKSNKLKAFLFTAFIALLIVTPIVCIFLNFYMQFLANKYAHFTSYIIIGVLLHLFISVIVPLYYYCLNILTNKEEHISYMKMFIVHITDIVSIIMITIFVVCMILFINFII
jgi:hypothetical protein